MDNYFALHLVFEHRPRLFRRKNFVPVAKSQFEFQCVAGRFFLAGDDRFDGRIAPDIRKMGDHRHLIRRRRAAAGVNSVRFSHYEIDDREKQEE